MAYTHYTHIHTKQNKTKTHEREKKRVIIQNCKTYAVPDQKM